MSVIGWMVRKSRRKFASGFFEEVSAQGWISVERSNLILLELVTVGTED